MYFVPFAAYRISRIERPFMENFFSELTREQKGLFNSWMESLVKKLSQDRVFRKRVLMDFKKAMKGCDPSVAKLFSLKIVEYNQEDVQYEMDGNKVLIKVPTAPIVDDSALDLVSGGLYTKIEITHGKDGKIYRKDGGLFKTDGNTSIEADTNTGAFRIRTSEIE